MYALFQNKIRGNESEARVFHALQKMTNGGIVVGSLKMQDITGNRSLYDVDAASKQSLTNEERTKQGRQTLYENAVHIQICQGKMNCSGSESYLCKRCYVSEVFVW